MLALLALVIVLTAPDVVTNWRMRQARQAMVDGDHEAAIEILRDEDSGLGEFLRARCYRRLGKAQEMATALKRAENLGFDRNRTRTERTLYMAQTGQLQRVISQLPKLLRTSEEDLPAICEAFANGYLANHRINDAVRILDGWATDFPDDPRPLVLLGMIEQDDGNFTQAAEWFRKALELDDGRNLARIQLARALISLHEFDAAVKEARRACVEEPDNADAFCVLGQALRNTEDETGARKQLDQAVKLAPDHFDALLELGQLHNDAGRYDEAVSVLTRAFDLRPYQVDARFALGTALRGTGRVDEATEHFEYCTEANEAKSRIRANLDKIALDGRLVEERFEVATLLMEYGSPIEAAVWLRSVVQMDPNHAPAHQALVEYYEKEDRRDAAQRHREILNKLLVGS